MSELDIVIPVYNEAESVNDLTRRLDVSMSQAGIDYNIIFVDDNSTDDTVQRVLSLEKSYSNGKNGVININGNGSGDLIFDASNGYTNGSRIKLLCKKGRKGKAYSILEAIEQSKAPYIAMIDGDLQYPPEVVPEMYRLAKDKGVVVANRKDYKTNGIRRLGTKANNLIFEKLLHGLECDTQSGLKVFKRDIIENVDKDDISEWTLDLPLLLTARKLGYEIGSVDITFEERQNGESKVDFIKAAKEIAKNSVSQKFKKNGVYQIKSDNKKDMLGAGVAYRGRKFITHTQLPEEISALKTFYKWQKPALISILGVIATALIINPILTGIVLLSILTFLYFIDLVFNISVLLKSLHFPPEIKISDEEILRLDDKRLPIYSILCPLYKEANVLPAFVKAINKLDWPKEKLDVQLLLEEDDRETIEAAEGLNLEKHFKIIVVPHSLPKTKPKACNYGLAQASGEYVVIYDAEDKPDPKQLKKAYISFNKLDSKIVCLQSKLNYYNTEHNLLTKLFTAEYSLWFDLILPGLQSIETTIPLGGTSNHFKINALRFLDGWDPFNVTEDCDLGTRLFKQGFRTALIDSTTLEEANSRPKSWLKQRSRWIKGYMQTYLVHMRDPVEFYKKHGIHSLIFQLVIGMRMVFMLINPILWITTASYFLLNDYVGSAIEALYPAPVFYIAVATLVFGNFVYVYNYMIGCAKRHQWGLIKYVFLMPVYWVMASIAAVKGFYQLLVKPHYWEKTSHGLDKQKSKIESPQIEVTIDYTDLVNPGRISKIPAFFYNFVLSIAKNIADLLGLFSRLYSHTKASSGGLNILVFNWRDTKHVWTGGAEVYLHELAKDWVEKGHKVTMFCGWDAQTNRDEIIDGVEIIRRGGFYTVYLFAVLYYLFKLRGKYDVVVDSENGIPFFTPLFVKLPKILLIHHVHREVFQQHLSVPLRYIATALETKLMPYLYRNNQIITVSESSRTEIEKIGLGTIDKISIVSPGVNIPEQGVFTKTLYPSFLYLGRLKPYKNIDIAIKAFEKVLKEIPSARLSIAGDGESLWGLQQLVKKLNLSDKIQFLGRVSDEEKIRLLSESWVALQPSSFEGWGLTVVEANSCGTPVIASNVQGLRDSINNGETGILVELKDVSAFTREMINLVTNKKYLQNLSDSAYKWAKRFKWEYAARNLLEILEKEITAKKVTRGIPQVAETI